MGCLSAQDRQLSLSGVFKEDHGGVVVLGQCVRSLSFDRGRDAGGRQVGMLDCVRRQVGGREAGPEGGRLEECRRRLEGEGGRSAGWQAGGWVKGSR